MNQSYVFSKVLVADDESDLLSLYREVLEKANYSVITAQDGDECVEIYREEFFLGQSKIDDMDRSTPFDVVILDYKMPNKNGLEAAKEILSLNPHQRIIFASGYLEGTILDSIKQLGRVVEIIKKPFSLRNLVDLIDNKEIFAELEKLNVNIGNLKKIKPNHESVKIYLEALQILQKGITN